MTEQDFLKAQGIRNQKIAFEARLKRIRLAAESNNLEFFIITNNERFHLEDFLSNEEVDEIQEKLFASVEAKIAKLEEEFADIK